jgi:hypothetical protein
MVYGRASLGLLSVTVPRGADWRGTLGSFARYVALSRERGQSARRGATPSPPRRRA